MDLDLEKVMRRSLETYVRRLRRIENIFYFIEQYFDTRRNKNEKTIIGNK